MLKGHGFTKVWPLKGGTAEWVEADYPVEPKD